MNEYDLLKTAAGRDIDTLDSIRAVDADLTCPFCGGEDVYELPIRQINLGLGCTKLVANQNFCRSCETYYDPSFSWFWIPDFDMGIPTTMCHEGAGASSCWTIWVHETGVGPLHRHDADAQRALYEYYFGLSG